MYNTKIQIKKGVKSGLNVRYKDFWYSKINLTQIWYDEFINHIRQTKSE